MRDTLLEYRFRFENIVGRIDRLVTFKGVHDLLHHLQLHCYDAILRDVPRIAEDDAVVDAIDFYADDLQGTIEQLRKLDLKPMFANARLTWIDTLERAREILSVGVSGRDEAGVRNAARLLDRVLASEPARIDAKLGESAAELELEAVIDAVAFVCRTGRESGMEREKITSLEEARDVMEQLEENLEILVRSHALWQDVDVVMRRVDTSIDAKTKETFELEDTWLELKQQVAVLSAAHAAWVQPLRDESRAVDEAIAGKDAVKMVRYFQRFRKKATNRFFAVDADLKEQCEELGCIGKPLAEIVEALA
ncbi:MAG TPA: hypothetical protein VFV49_10875 [Thermoanaerobaculia bacterium]|nr:hypothetical protein [Thermoanaerobaculia bacterium]